jgi:hypothetical protein
MISIQGGSVYVNCPMSAKAAVTLNESLRLTGLPQLCRQGSSTRSGVTLAADDGHMVDIFRCTAIASHPAESPRGEPDSGAYNRIRVWFASKPSASAPSAAVLWVTGPSATVLTRAPAVATAGASPGSPSSASPTACMSCT